ncbi:MAG: response regulator [Gorillibacterium sp.]|nr:response regulator [Gorillibacterium sp.]
MKVLIVDDDRLVRKGIISLMPWEEFGLHVVGEAENGNKALQFLENNAVDLVMTDIVMPTMSGVDLLRAIRQHYPHICVVMLTFYQDFELVQEALRLGAIDYIAKVELEKDNMHDILSRIVRRVNDSAVHSDVVPSVFHSAGLAVPQGSERALLFAALTPEWPDFLGEILSAEQQQVVVEIDSGIWLLPDLSAQDEEDIITSMFDRPGCPGKWAAIRVSGIRDNSRKRMYKLLADYSSLHFFYEYRPGRNVYDVDLDMFKEELPQLSEKELYQLQERWLSLELVFDEDHFRKLIEELERLKPSAAKLESIFYWLLVQWESCVHLDLTALFETAQLRCWADWLLWLDMVRKKIRHAFLGVHYSEEVMAGILRAVDYINRNLSLELKLTEVAEDVHISRSHFSECFRNMTGKTFNEYIRDGRIGYSQLLLTQTNEPIYRIAEKCGYPDEKYFSKVFRKKVGILPSEARRRGQV